MDVRTYSSKIDSTAQCVIDAVHDFKLAESIIDFLQIKEVKIEFAFVKIQNFYYYPIL